MFMMFCAVNQGACNKLALRSQSINQQSYHKNSHHSKENTAPFEYKSLKTTKKSGHNLQINFDQLSDSNIFVMFFKVNPLIHCEISSVNVSSSLKIVQCPMIVQSPMMRIHSYMSVKVLSHPGHLDLGELSRTELKKPFG